MSDDDYSLDPSAYTPRHAYISHRPADARQVILDLTCERDEARAEVKRLRAERDTLLLDAREFVRWFEYHFGHVYMPSISSLRAINDRLNAHSDTLAALDAAMAKIDKEGAP